jgi:hypothetical protein
MQLCLGREKTLSLVPLFSCSLVFKTFKVSFTVQVITIFAALSIICLSAVAAAPMTKTPPASIPDSIPATAVVARLVGSTEVDEGYLPFAVAVAIEENSTAAPVNQTPPAFNIVAGARCRPAL